MYYTKYFQVKNNLSSLAILVLGWLEYDPVCLIVPSYAIPQTNYSTNHFGMRITGVYYTKHFSRKNNLSSLVGKINAILVAGI